jgi:AraC family transcriptional regulator
VEDYVSQHLAEEIALEKMTELVKLSPFHFSRLFKETTGTSPLAFRDAKDHACTQLIRETSRSLIEIAVDVGYTSRRHFAQVFRRIVSVTPSEFRSAL